MSTMVCRFWSVSNTMVTRRPELSRRIAVGVLLGRHLVEQLVGLRQVELGELLGQPLIVERIALAHRRLRRRADADEDRVDQRLPVDGVRQAGAEVLLANRAQP